MQTTLNALAALRRPRLLISAARFGIAQYDRETVLDRLFGVKVPAPGKPCLTKLLALEDEVERNRRRNSGEYRIADHVEILAAIMAESQVVGQSPANADMPEARGTVVDFAERLEATN